MEAEFWHQRWQDQQIGFHQPQVNSYLVEYWPSLELPPGATVLVPCCGKSLDMVWLQQQGYKVIGVEISELAVSSFFDEQGLTPQVSTLSDRDYRFTRWQCGDIELLCGDIFTLPDELIKQVAAVYDRASLIAMPADMRQQYGHKLLSVMPAASVLFLITLCYPAEEMEGPPFSVCDQEVRNLFQHQFEIEQMAGRDILQGEDDFFRQRGLSQLHELCYIMRPLAGSAS